MQIQERLIVPGLGVVILLSVLILGVPWFYKVILGLLGLAASATYFAPHAVQVETRMAIAALGLIILLIVTSTAFWLALLSFAAIAALQFQHRHTLQRSSATLAWLNALLQRGPSAPANPTTPPPADANAAPPPPADANAAPPPPADADAAPAGAEAASPAAPRAQAPQGLAVPAFVRLSLAGIGGSVLGVGAAVMVFVPWVFVMISGGTESETFDFTLRHWAELEDDQAVTGFLVILLLLGLASIASIVLPRIAAALIGAAGLVVTIISYVYLFGEFENAMQGELPSWVDATLLPSGAVLAAFCYMGIMVLQLIPALNKPRAQAPLVMACLLTAILAAVGCGNGTAGGTTPSRDALLLKLLPEESYGVVYIDAATLFADDDLRDIQRIVENNWDDFVDLRVLFDLDIEELDYVAVGDAESGNMVLVAGIDDLDGLRDDLDRFDYDDDEIEGEEVWVSDEEYWNAVAILDGAVLFARNEDDMEDALERWKEEDDAYADEVEDVIDLLPSGVAWSIRYCGSDCARGEVLEKAGGDEVRLHSYTRFDDDDEAEEAWEEIEDDIDDENTARGCRDLKGDLDDEMIQLSVVCDIDDAEGFIREIVTWP